ncbi:MAG: AAA family ATPase [Candidatus Woesearchaeota archaeon]
MFFSKKDKKEKDLPVSAEDANNEETVSMLEMTLRGIFWTPQMTYAYNDGKSEVRLGTYTLPLEARMGRLFANLILDDRPANREVGFVFDGKYYTLTPESNIKEGMPESDNFICLPLLETKYKVALGANENGKFVQHEGSPFNLAGLKLKSDKEPYPLMLIIEGEKDNQVKGLFRRSGRLQAYNYSGIDEDKLKGMLQLISTFASEKHTVLERSTAPAAIVKGGKKKFSWRDPESIVDYLSAYVVGQEEAKRQIAVSFSNYMIRAETRDEEFPKENMLIVGPSGVGKTYMISLLAKKANLPYIETKLSAKATSGLVGENLGYIFGYLRGKTSDQSPYAVVFIDEIDKLCTDSWSNGGSDMGPRLQNEIIGWLEEAEVGVEEVMGKKAWTTMNTRNIMFVAAGAFCGLQNRSDSLKDIVAKRIGRENGGKPYVRNGDICHIVPRQDDDYATLARVMPEDLISYGLMPELVGRMPILAPMHSLSIEDKVRILTCAKDSPFSKYGRVLQLRGYELEVDENVARIVAERCPPETGARALSQLTSRMFSKIIYNPQPYIKEKNVILLSSDAAGKLLSGY